MADNIQTNAAAATVLKEASNVAKELVASAAVDAAKILKDASEHVTNISVMANDLQYVRKDVADIKNKLENQYVTKIEFEQTKWVVRGIMAVFGTAMAYAILKLIFIH